MKGLILVFVVLLYIIYFSYNLISTKIDTNAIYVIGVYMGNAMDKKMASNIIALAEERNIDMIVKLYENYYNLVKDVNNIKIDFAIVPEDYHVDSFLGLNVFKNKPFLNNRFMIGLYFNYFYMISDVFYNDKEHTSKFTKMSDIKYFKSVYRRNYIIGTEPIGSNSYASLILVLKMYNINVILFNKYDDTQHYDDNVVFIITETKENLYKRYINKRVDGLFILDIQNSRFISTIVRKSDAVFINLDLDKTVFDSLLSNIYSKTKLNINQFYTNTLLSNFSKNGITPRNKLTYVSEVDLDETQPLIVNKKKELESVLTNLGVFDTRSIRYIMVTNNTVSKDIVYKLSDIILRNNNFLINKTLYNQFSNVEHGLFEPVDVIYVDKNLLYHEGASQLYMEMKYISYDKQDIIKANADSDDKHDYYWKYSKIGLKHFKFEND